MSLKKSIKTESMRQGHMYEPRSLENFPKFVEIHGKRRFQVRHVEDGGLLGLPMDSLIERYMFVLSRARPTLRST